MGDFYNRGGGALVLTDLEVDGTTIVVDETNDRVGIGTDSPDGRLHVMKGSAGSVTASGDGNALVVESDDVAGMTLLSPGDGVIYFGDAADNDEGRIVYKHSDNSMNLWTNNAVRLTVDSSGDATFTGDVTVSGGDATLGTAGNTTATTISTIVNTGTTVGKALTIAAGGTTTGANNLNGGDLTLSSGSGDGTGTSSMRFHTKVSGVDAAAERMRIHTNGNVGIGTAAPTSLLTLSAEDAYIALQNTTAENGDGGAETRILFVDHAGNALAQIEGSHSGSSDDDKGKLVFSTNNASDADPQPAVTVNENQNVGIKDTAPKVSLNVIHDYQAVAFETQLADGEGGGRVLRYSPNADDALTLGQLYFLHSDGTWDSTDASAIATGGTQLLGIGLGNARTAGCLMEGFIRIPSTEIEGTPGSGAVDGLPLFVSETAGHITFTQPTTGSAFVRIVGHAIDDDSSNVLIYFNPSHNHVLL